MSKQLSQGIKDIINASMKISKRERAKSMNVFLKELYQAYIDGRRELREINMEFNARYTRGAAGPDRSGCGLNESSDA